MEAKHVPLLQTWKPDLTGNFLLGAFLKSEGEACRRSPVLWDFIKFSYFPISKKFHMEVNYSKQHTSRRKEIT